MRDNAVDDIHNDKKRWLDETDRAMRAGELKQYGAMFWNPNVVETTDALWHRTSESLFDVKFSDGRIFGGNQDRGSARRRRVNRSSHKL